MDAPLPNRVRRTGITVENRQALAQVRALLGNSRLASNLNQLAHLAHIGALPLDPETLADLAEAVTTVREIKRLLMTALGRKADGAP